MENQKTILIVDDQEVGRTLLESILYKENFNLLFAADGDEAFYQAKSNKPDLILLDVMMPKSDGYQVCQRIRGDNDIQDTPIILVTALDDRDSRIRGFEAGANDYISKPIDRSELLARSKNLIKLYEYKKMLHGNGHDPSEKNETKMAVDGVISKTIVPEKTGVPVSSLFTEYATIAGEDIKEPGLKQFFYTRNGKIYGLFLLNPDDLQLISLFQNALLTNDESFESFLSEVDNQPFLILIIDRLLHQVRGWSKGISCLIYGENKISSVFPASPQETQNYIPHDTLIITTQPHMEKLFETGVLQDILNEDDGQFKHAEILKEWRMRLKNTNMELHFFTIG